MVEWFLPRAENHTLPESQSVSLLLLFTKGIQSWERERGHAFQWVYHELICTCGLCLILKIDKYESYMPILKVIIIFRVFRLSFS